MIRQIFMLDRLVKSIIAMQRDGGIDGDVFVVVVIFGLFGVVIKLFVTVVVIARGMPLYGVMWLNLIQTTWG